MIVELEVYVYADIFVKVYAEIFVYEALTILEAL